MNTVMNGLPNQQLLLNSSAIFYKNDRDSLYKNVHLFTFQSPYYWPWQGPRVGGGSGAPALGPDNVEYAIYLVKRTLRNKQRHGLEDYELEALANLKKNLAAKWDFITMQAEEQVTLIRLEAATAVTDKSCYTISVLWSYLFRLVSSKRVADC